MSPMRSLSFRRRVDNTPQCSVCSPACGSTKSCAATAASCSPATPSAASSSVERWSSPESASTRLRSFDAANKALVQERSSLVYQKQRLVRTDDLKAADLSLWLQHCRRENGLHKEHLEAISRRMYRDGLARKGDTLNAADMGSWFEHIQRENRLHKEHLEAISRRMHRDGLMTRSELELWLEGPEEDLAVLSPAARSLLKQRQAATSPHERRSWTDSSSELRREETTEETAGAASPGSSSSAPQRLLPAESRPWHNRAREGLRDRTHLLSPPIPRSCGSMVSGNSENRIRFTCASIQQPGQMASPARSLP